jgi:methylisocitrate lyase
MNLITRCKEFRQLLTNDCIMIPGCFNGLIARLAAQHGFRALYVSGGALTASSGVPDIGLRSLNEFCSVIKDVSTFSNLPVIADADTGFGEGEMCARTVSDFFYSGASGLHIEDQVFPKRCGHLNGKELISVQQMVDKIKIARETSVKVSDGEFVICARTDAKGVYGLEECISRSKSYINAGADMIFPEGLDTAEEFQIVAKELKSHKSSVFLLANMTEFGKTPYIDIKTFKEYGYNCVIYPVSTLRVAMKAVDSFFTDLQQHGSQKNFVDKMQSRKELYDLLRYTPGKEWHFPENERKK